MKKALAILVVVAGLALVGVGVFSYLQGQKPNAKLKIESEPEALVFVDNVQLGQTPLEKIFKPGEVSVKLIPVTGSTSLATYQTKVRLVNGVITTIRRQFGSSEADSAGETLSLEVMSGKTASIGIIASGPDAASVVVDGDPVGFTPLSLSDISVGDHQITLSAAGFKPRQISALTMAGYRLNINARLAADVQLVASPAAEIEDVLAAATSSAKTTSNSMATPKPTLAKPYVEILDTPTGFLRVRQTASTSGKEMGRVDPGERFSVLDTATDWYHIKVDLEATTSGWISAQYAQLFK